MIFNVITNVTKLIFFRLIYEDSKPSTIIMTNQTNYQPNLVTVFTLGLFVKWTGDYLAGFIGNK